MAAHRRTVYLVLASIILIVLLFYVFIGWGHGSGGTGTGDIFKSGLSSERG